MPDPVSSPTPARRTSWWFRLLRGVLNLALLGLLGLQIFAVVALGTDYHLRLPGFARHALEARLQDQGLTISFSGMDVSLAGSLLLHEPKVFLAGGAEPVAEADLLYADPDWLALLVGHRLSFREVRLINANFYCPPESSPTGLREPFITRLDTALMGQGASWWRLDHLQARFLNALIFAQGTFLLPPLATAPSPSATLAALYRQWSRKLVDLGPQFARVDNPYFEIRLEGEEPGWTKIHLAALAEHARPPVPGLEFGRETLRLGATWDGQALRANTPAFASIKSVSYIPDAATEPKREVFSAHDVSARIVLANGPAGVFTAAPLRCTASAASAKIDDFPCDSLSANLDLREWPSLPLSANAMQGMDAAQVSGIASLTPHDGTVDWHGGNFVIRADARLTTLLAAAHLPLPALAKPLQIDGPLHADGQVAIAPDRQIESANFTVHTGGAHFERIDLASAFARGRLSRDATGDYVFELPRVVAASKSWRMEGAYVENLRTHDFRITGRGNIEPRVLDPYFTFAAWWTPLWQALVPGREWPSGEVSYAGNWDNSPADNHLELAARLDGARMRGVPTDSIRLRVQTRSNYITVYDIDARATGGGKLAGALVWVVTPNYARVIEQHGVVDSTLPLAAIAALGGPEIANTLRPFDCPTPPVAHVDQRVAGAANAHPGAVATKIHAEVTTPFRAFRAPIDSLMLDFTDYGSWADVPRCDFTLAGGDGHARATVIHHADTGDVLSFSALLHAARDTDFLAALGQLNYLKTAAAPTNPGNAPSEKNATAALGDPAHPALLDVALAGRMTLSRPESLVATGSGRLTGTQLVQLHLLGSLSRAMADTKVPLGDFNLNAATSDLQIANQYVRLPNIVMTGPTARIVAAGLYNYNADDLNFKVLIFPIGEWDTFVLKQISNVANPFSNTMTFKLHGKMNNPTWDVSMDPLRIFENHTLEGPSIPGYPANDDGSPIFPALPPVPPLPAK